MNFNTATSASLFQGRLPEVMPGKVSIAKFWKIKALREEIERDPRCKQENEKLIAALRDQIIVGNLRLIPGIAEKKNTSLHDRDLWYSAGTMGLIKAVDLFDVTMGWQFSTYAYRAISHAIGGELDDQHLLYSKAIMDRVQRTKTAMAALHASGVLDPTPEQIVGQLNQIAKLRGWKTQEVTATAAATYKRIVEQERIPNTESMAVLWEPSYTVDSKEDLEDEDRHRRVREAMDKVMGLLNDRERLIIERKYGLNGHEPMSLKDVGLLPGVAMDGKEFITKERVRQILIKVFDHVRNSIDSPYESSIH